MVTLSAVMVEYPVRHASVYLQFPRRVRCDSWADWHRIRLLQLPQQRGHVPCVHKAALHRGGHAAGNVTPWDSDTPFEIHMKWSDKFPSENNISLFTHAESEIRSA